MNITRLIKILKSKKSNNKFSIKNYSNYISFWSAGLGYENRRQEVLNCNLYEIIKLEREPFNEVDSNAIHLKRSNGNSLGFIGKELAEKIAPLLDEKKLEPFAQIISLKCDPNDKAFGVKVAVGLDEDLHLKLNSFNKKIDITFDQSENGNLYLLVECDETILDEIVRLLEDNNIPVIRYGISYIDSSDGNYYSWYIRLENDTNKESVEKLLRNQFEVLSQKYDQEIDKAYIGIQDEQIDNLNNIIYDLKGENKKLNETVKNLSKRSKQKSETIKSVIDTLLPNVEFLRDSEEILYKELGNFSIPIKLLLDIINSGNHLKIKPVNGVPSKWLELHFNTGRADDGRLYFKRANNKINVLISFKKSQKKDIEFLKTK